VIVLDTNVVSEPMRSVPSPHVIAWLDAQHVETLYLTTVTLAELRYGIAALPAGRRRTQLHQRLEDETLPLFAGRILPFDEGSSRSYATLQATARGNGRTVGVMDGMIAAVCAARGHAIATRNVRDFAQAGIDVVNPWEAQAR